MDDFDRRWERIQQQLLSQARGDEPPRVASQRTLFGIPSGVERQMERFAEQIEQERKERVAARRREKETLMNGNPTLNVADVVELEQRIAADGTPLYELMKRAGAALAARAGELTAAGRRIVVLAGPGNNGGDGWVAAELFVAAGRNVTLVSAKEPSALTAEPARTAALHAIEACGERLHVLAAPGAAEVAAALQGAGLAIDALLGTGFAHSTLREPLAGWVRSLNAAHAKGLAVLACDVASGVSAQTGEAANPHVLADATVTMMVLKPGLLTGAGEAACGSIQVAQIHDLAPYGAFLQERAL